MFNSALHPPPPGSQPPGGGEGGLVTSTALLGHLCTTPSTQGRHTTPGVAGVGSAHPGRWVWAHQAHTRPSGRLSAPLLLPFSLLLSQSLREALKNSGLIPILRDTGTGALGSAAMTCPQRKQIDKEMMTKIKTLLAPIFGVPITWCGTQSTLCSSCWWCAGSG